mmetsp:Transcript_2011/g.2365  ORF Transcript_2011/g.2365 Transcript_2011/m.2365 type:complete len:215 (+) Transcript_2011:301-945(+)
MTSLPPAKRDIAISKSLSYLLRHGAVKEKLNIDQTGYININELLNHNRLKTNKVTLDDIRRIVENNDKKRFTIVEKEGEIMICANQGHSIKTVNDSNLTQLTKETIPEEIYHGTYKNKLPSIFNSGGLSKMNRNHIHFASNISDISGIRASSNVLIYLNIEKCLESGIIFYKSSNNVILTPGDAHGLIRVELFSKVVDAKNGSSIDINQFGPTL